MKTRRPIGALVAGVVLALVVGSPATADPIRDAQWHLGYLQVHEAHRYSQGEGIVVGVIDTGVDAGHPDLAGNVLPGADFVQGTGDGRTDLDGHGTAVAGLIAAHGRARGIAPKARILSVRDKHSRIDVGATSADAIAWAVDHGAKVLCLAFSTEHSYRLQEAIEEALRRDVVVVAAIGNEPEARGLLYPAAYPGVLAVAGVDQHGNHADFSVVSPFTMLAAPAVDILSTDIRSGDGRTGYARTSGTTDAAAIVAGAAALVRARYPHLSAREVIHRLTATADDKGLPGRDDHYGYGVVNLVQALTAHVPPLQPTGSPPPRASASAAKRPATLGLGRASVVIAAIALLTLLCVAFAATFLPRRTRQ